MGQLGAMVGAVCRRWVGHSENLIRGITPDIAARLPLGLKDGTPVRVQTNHPAFVFGHLSLYPARLWTMRGLDPGAIAPTPEWLELFQRGSVCRDDVEGTIYPAWSEILSRFRTGYEAVMAELPRLEDDVFFRANTDPKSKEAFPTLGMAFMVLFGSHVTMHLGQVSAWRRFSGLGSAT